MVDNNKNIYERFIDRVKKIYITNKTIETIFIIGVIIFAIFGRFPIIGKLIIISIVVYLFLKNIINYLKYDRLWKKLNNDERKIIMNELNTLFFEGIDYALTDNYIVDFKKLKMIPFKSITKVIRDFTIPSTMVNSHLKYSVKIYTKDSSYRYITKYASLVLRKDYEDPLYYNKLYEYIIFKNPKLK